MIDVSLNNIAQGAVGELFEREMGKVLENIADASTPAVAPREITIKIKMVPKEDRTTMDVAISVSTKVAPSKPADTTLYLGLEERDGELQPTAKEANVAQTMLGFTPQEAE